MSFFIIFYDIILVHKNKLKLRLKRLLYEQI